jgi:alkanesulfonate monooxygenase SsuD/methylene tetrahydromethanopterin reductase-like flavin-dependent oxidoreductase (luciferase family)
MKVRLGYVLENFGDGLNPENLVVSAQTAEKIGFHSIWATDHIIRPRENNYPLFNNLSEAITTISFLAGKTSSVQIGISTLVLPQRNPILAAKQLATISYLTEGRLTISFGAGQNAKEFNYLQQSFKNRGKRFNEQIELIQSLWKGDASFDGNYYSYSDAIFSPLPETPNDMYIAGNSEFAIRRAIKYNLGWHPTSLSPNKLVEALDNLNLRIEDIQVMIRLTVHDLHNLLYVIDEYKEIGVDYIILRLPSGLEGLKEAEDVLSSFLNSR